MVVLPEPRNPANRIVGMGLSSTDGDVFAKSENAHDGLRNVGDVRRVVGENAVMRRNIAITVIKNASNCQ